MPKLNFYTKNRDLSRKSHENFEMLIINGGKEDLRVIILLNKYNALMATRHELSSRKNATRLDMAIQKLQSKRLFKITDREA